MSHSMSSGTCTPAAPAAAQGVRDPSAVKYWAGLYTTSTQWKKKNAGKKYQDGVVMLDTASLAATLFSKEGKEVGRGKVKQAPSADTDTVTIGSWVFELDRAMEPQEFSSGQCFIAKQYQLDAHSSGPSTASMLSMAGVKKGFTLPLMDKGATGGGAPSASHRRRALHDPHDPNALILNRLQWEESARQQPNAATAIPVVPVVVDPYVSQVLRPHQREGVQFMYTCSMGLSTSGGQGCILADEMGLGKSLQVIALVWTLLRQGPKGSPAVRKALIVAPATLVRNWAAEVKKWLGTERLDPLVLGQDAQDAKQKVMDIKLGTRWQLMISSYETIRTHADSLQGVFELLVCDEGHRLKATGGNKTIDALKALQCPRHILLTGTPMQNNLDELYALHSFVIPDVLSSLTTFKNVFGTPISRSRDRDASAQEVELGKARAKQLKAKTDAHMLRRTQAATIAKYLPPLTKLVLFCKPSRSQVELYQALLKSLVHDNKLLVGGAPQLTLKAITALRMLCNHPCLVASDLEVDAGSTGLATPDNPALSEDSGKLQCLSSILQHVVSCGQRAVCVSTTTKMLDLVASLMCQPLGLSTARIDGSTGVQERQSIVDSFNMHGTGQVFLLSTRAGGAGLNLIGANHLVLVDSDWNPACDLQAMARIWRDGQKHPCYVYRLLTTGTIEEKIFQRQIQKIDLAEVTMSVADGEPGNAPEGGSGSSKRGQFTKEELRELFSLNLDTASDTKDLLCALGSKCISWMEGLAGASSSSAAAAPASAQAGFLAAMLEGGGVVTCVGQYNDEPAAEA